MCLFPALFRWASGSFVRTIGGVSRCPSKREVDFLTKYLLEASVAVWFVVLFLESSFVELFQTEGTYEMFRMEFLKHGCDATTSDGFRTASTQWTTLGMIMGFAIRQAFMIEEWTSLERLSTILQRKIQKKIKLDF